MQSSACQHVSGHLLPNNKVIKVCTKFIEVQLFNQYLSCGPCVNLRVDLVTLLSFDFFLFQSFVLLSQHYGKAWGIFVCNTSKFSLKWLDKTRCHSLCQTSNCVQTQEAVSPWIRQIMTKVIFDATCNHTVWTQSCCLSSYSQSLIIHWNICLFQFIPLPITPILLPMQRPRFCNTIVLTRTGANNY